jgi:predicted MFS family arabinose efflux permease
VLLAAFVVNEQRGRNPLVPLSIFRVKGLAAADVTQLIALAGFYSMFFFLTLYMQNVLGYSQLKAGAAYLPLCAGVAVRRRYLLPDPVPDRDAAHDRRGRADLRGRPV